MQSGIGWKRVHSTVVKEAATTMQEESSSGEKACSAFGIAQTLDRPVSTVNEILHCYPYKISHVRELFPSDRPAKRDFCFKISCSHGSGQRMAVKNFVGRQSPFPSDRMC